MHHDYADIRALSPLPPLWFDEYAVPRYVPFHPYALANIYAQDAVLAEIACQGCDHIFHVAFSHGANHNGPLAEAIVANTLHYGDPPNITCCAAGPTMNSVPRRVLEFWYRRTLSLPDPSGIVERLRRDGPAVRGKSTEDWARHFADTAALFADHVEGLRTEHALIVAEAEADRVFAAWRRYPIFEVPIYPDWILPED